MEERTELAVIHRFYCALCGARYRSPGMCDEHPDEPLLDLGDEEVTELLREIDRQAGLKRFGLMLGIGQFAALPLAWLAAVALELVIGDVVILGLVVVYAVVLLVWTLIGTRLFPARRRTPELEEREILALRAARAAERL